MADTTDLLGFAIEKNPVDFADALNQMLQQKAQEALETHRVTLAQAIHGGEAPEDVDLDAETDDVGDDEFEFSDDELDDLGDDDDLDLDLEDLDLEDLDLDDDNEDDTNAEDA
jgi:hypothetical protein